MDQEASEALEGLRRADTQMRVLLLLIQGDRDMNNHEVAEAIGLSINAVNIALHNLNNKGLVERISRGVYRYKLGPILTTLLKKYLEEG